MTRLVALAVTAVLAAGCAVGGGGSDDSRVDRCVERLLSRARPEHLTDERRPVVERYTRKTYCERFQQQRWIYPDGTLSIEAHRWVLGGMRCAVAGDGEPAREVECDDGTPLDELGAE